MPKRKHKEKMRNIKNNLKWCSRNCHTIWMTLSRFYFIFLLLYKDIKESRNARSFFLQFSFYHATFNKDLWMSLILYNNFPCVCAFLLCLISSLLIFLKWNVKWNENYRDIKVMRSVYPRAFCVIASFWFNLRYGQGWSLELES